MTTVIRYFPGPKSKMSVAPVQWLPGAVSGMLPYFALINGSLFLRADDPNLYGVNTGLQNTPVVQKNGVTSLANKGFNFYSAPWCISTFPARDLGSRTKITTVDQSVYDYITALYGLVGPTTITLADWRLEQPGYVKHYQVLQGSMYVNIAGTTYFGGTSKPFTQVAGVAEKSVQMNPLISNDFTYDSPTEIVTYQLPFNTFYAVDTPIVISATDTSHPDKPRIYFTLLNNVTMYNGPNYDG